MARVIKFPQSRRQPSWRWPVEVRNRRWQARGRSKLRPQTWALVVALVFLSTLTMLNSGWAVSGSGIAARPAPVAGWMGSANAERFVDSGWPDRSEPVEHVSEGISEHANSVSPDTVTVHRSGDAVAASAPVQATGRFSLCHSGGGTNCVVDGDTFWMGGEKIRIADIDTPETHPARCAAEATKGAAATRRLQALLNAGPFALETVDRDSDRYGRKLTVVTRDGASIGGVLVTEGLARWYDGGRQPWC